MGKLGTGFLLPVASASSCLITKPEEDKRIVVEELSESADGM